MIRSHNSGTGFECLPGSFIALRSTSGACAGATVASTGALVVRARAGEKAAIPVIKTSGASRPALVGLTS